MDFMSILGRCLLLPFPVRCLSVACFLASMIAYPECL
uniref:Putative membrane protein n=1 Tax=Escherichia coli TaxID=562 RepID=A0A2P0V4D3_ECOLX|nr:putative membrane protein [Escherichia coli]ASU05369.1 putative membrane protein [Escherichia coli]